MRNRLAPTRPWPSITFVLLAVLFLIALGGVNARQQYLTRGIPTVEEVPLVTAPTEIGLNVSLEQYDSAELVQVLDEIDQLDVRHLKQALAYTPEPDWGPTDTLFDTLGDYPNFEIALMLDGNPDNGFTPPEVESYAAWAAEVATRYRDQVSVYIIWDEPNIASHWGGLPINPDRYGAMLTASAHAIREIDPDAQIMLAPLAPTTESGIQNLSDILFLEALYENGSAEAFDIVSMKPYGFNDSPLDRDTDPNLLNFNRAILVREVMLRYGDKDTPIVAGNWGWNHLPADWAGPSSIWGEATAEQKWEYIEQGFERARAEWPWMSVMYLHHWEPNAQPDDPIQGFALRNDPQLGRLATFTDDDAVAYPGFHFADPDTAYSEWVGDWEFSPEFGADMSEKTELEPSDSVTIEFWGTDVGLRVRRANYRARFYVEIDGEPANLLPPDETTFGSDGRGSALVLNTNDPDLDFISIVPVAEGLSPGRHTMTVTAFRGWDQFALNGFAVGYRPPSNERPWQIGLSVLAAMSTVLSVWTGLSATWSFPRLTGFFKRLTTAQQIALTFVAGVLVTLSGFSIWGIEGGSIYRRSGDLTQIGIVAGTAVLFYVTPWLIVYLVALLLLFWLILARPAWGLTLVAFAFPFAVSEVSKPIYIYRFSPVEIFMLVTFGAVMIRWLFDWAARAQAGERQRLSLRFTDWLVIAFIAVVTVTLFFTARLDVALSDYRRMILEPALFYAAFRLLRPSGQERTIILSSFIASGLAIALIGLGQYATGTNLITAEGGLMRLRATYGSPNNVSLYLGRIVPLLFAALLFRSPQWRGLPAFWQNRRTLIEFGILTIVGIAYLLTFSRGGLFIGLPISLFTVFALWQWHHGRRVWPWLAGGIGAGILAYFALIQVPALAGRLDIRSATTVFRLNLWISSWQMWLDHPWFGVGLDNFLYEYRGRYILARAWEEPNLNHPHNILFDLLTRLGLFGLVAGFALLTRPVVLLVRRWRNERTPQALALTAGLLGAMAHTFAHGMVDHAFFLVDLAFAFYLILAFALPENPTDSF